jgi:parallel beta-helix repeat protein
MSRKGNAIWLVLMILINLVVILIEIAPVVKAPTTIYVDDMPGAGPGNPAENFTKIQDAINAANLGDTVYVYSGTYYENVLVNKTINLTGKNRDTTIIDGGGGAETVQVEANWVNVSGFTFTNGNNEGINLYYVQNCTIFNNNAFSNKYGIRLSVSFNNNITGNTASNNDRGIALSGAERNNIKGNMVSNNMYGIYGVGGWNNITSNTVISNTRDGIHLGGSIINNIIGNNISNNRFGISLLDSRWHTISDNTMINNGIGIDGEELEVWNSHDIDTSNTVNGKPVYYWKNQTGGKIPDGAGEVVLANSTNVSIKGQELTFGSVGILLGFSSNNYISSNTVSNNFYGIRLAVSSGNNIIGNIASYNKNRGISIRISERNSIIGNTANSNGWSGIDLNVRSNNNTLTGNTVSNDSYGFFLDDDCINNRIYHNNIINNSNQANDDTSNGNQWDNGYPSGGNFWSDFDEPSEGAYDDYQGPNQDNPVNGDGIVDKGTIAGGGKNPYVIDFDSQDNYPLIVPSLLPPTLKINTSLNGKDTILHWDSPITAGIDHYLIYRSTSQTDFDFNTIWKNTSIDKELGELTPVPLRKIWNDTNAAFPGNMTNYKEQYYYVIRAVNVLGEVSGTSRTVGKWTKTFPKGISTFSLPLEPIAQLTIDHLLNSMNAEYIKWINPGSRRWMKHGEGKINNTLMKLGEGFEVKFVNQTNYTFTGFPGAMIIYDDDPGFLGFDHVTEAKNLTASVDSTGNVTLNWQEPASMGFGDWYEVYYSYERDGFFKTLGSDYDLACSPLGFGNNTTTISNLGAINPGARLYFMVVPFNSMGVRGASTYSIGIWTEEFLAQYDTFGIPLKLETNQNADWYCDNIPETVGINYFITSQQRWSWHSTRMPQGAFDPILVMGEGYQISTSGATKFVFIGK